MIRGSDELAELLGLEEPPAIFTPERALPAADAWLAAREAALEEEEAAMLAVWKVGKGFIKDFLEVHGEPSPHYNTLSSTIRNLEKKGYLKGKKYGMIIEYTPAVKEEEYKKKFMTGFVKNYFENSYKELVTFFAKEKKISAEELKEILSMIEGRRVD